MASPDDPLVAMIRAKSGHGSKHRLIRERALDDPRFRATLETDLESAGPDDTFQVVKAAKSSPLIDRIQSRVRAPGAPAAPPVNQRGGSSSGDPVPPAGGVDSMDIPHVHRHEGTTEKVRAYWHNHPHTHAVPHDPDDPHDVADHDRRDHLSDPRHQAALRGFGGWESKSAGATAADAIKAIQADSLKVEKLDTDRSIPLHWISERLAENATAIRQLSMSAELAELRKAATSNVRKAAVVDSFAMTPELAKMIRGAVNKAFEDLEHRIEGLNERTGGRRQ
jgi:hypothetical protein